MALDLTDTLDLDIMARDPLMLNQRLRLMLDFFMEDTDMVLVLDITARDPLMLSLKPRLMQVSFMEDMDMVLVWDIVDLDMVVLDMPDMVDMDIPIMVKLYLLSFLKQKLKVISDWQCIIQCPCLKGRNCFECNNKVITTNKKK